MQKVGRKPPYALLMAGDRALYNPAAAAATIHVTANPVSNLNLPLFSLPNSPHRSREDLGLCLSIRSSIFYPNRPFSYRSVQIRQHRAVVVRLQLGFLKGSVYLFRFRLSLGWGLFLVFKGEGEKGSEVSGKRMATMVARQGRQLQRYTSCGKRLVVGCIPYKLKMDEPFMEDMDKMVQVLVISSQKGHGMMFPKGGWESDETMIQAASREAMEEAGVQGNLEGNLGSWLYKSNRNNVFYEAVMFPLNVTDELAYWPEMEFRKRRWVTVAEAMEGCQHVWMRDALERLLIRLERLN